MGDRTSEVLVLIVAIMAVIGLLTLGFSCFAISKANVYNKVNDLVNQVAEVNNVVYTDLDQQKITGFKLKEVVSQSSKSDCAIIVSSLGFLGAQTGLGEKVGYSLGDGITPKPEGTLNGDISDGMMSKATPIVQLENISLKTSLGNDVNYPLAVNFGSVLKNSIVKAPDGDGNLVSVVYAPDGTANTMAFNATDVTSGEEVVAGSTFTNFNGTTEYAQSISYVDGLFITKLDFATDPTSRIVRYDRVSDFSKTSKTYSISDTSVFNSYILHNMAGDYVGLVFCQGVTDGPSGSFAGSGKLEETITYVDFVLSSTNHQKAGIDELKGDVVIPSTFEDNGVHYKVVGIDDSTFNSCTMLNSVVIPDTVTKVGSFAFSGCTNLTSVVMSKNVSKIEKYTFNECKNLKTINTIGSKITEVGEFAFYNCNNLEADIVIPSTCKTIGNYAFKDCSKIKSLTLSEGVEEIGSSSFSGCSSIESLIIPNTITKMDTYAFAKCSNLTSLTIGTGLTSLPDYAFFNCSSLPSVTIPNGINSIGNSAFLSCSALTSVTFDDTTYWYTGDSAGATTVGLSNSDLLNKGTAATYLKNTYSNDYWTKLDTLV